EGNLTQNIWSLRKALGERGNEPRYVVTIPGRGYSFTCLVEESPVEDSSASGAFVLPPSSAAPAETPEPAAPSAPAALAAPPRPAARPSLQLSRRGARRLPRAV